MSSKIVEAVYRLELNRHQLELNGGKPVFIRFGNVAIFNKWL